MNDVVLITPIGRSFWSKLDGAIDAGFSYTRSSGVAQLNLDSETVYRKPAFAARLSVSVTQTAKDDDSSGEERVGMTTIGHRLKRRTCATPGSRWFVFVGHQASRPTRASASSCDRELAAAVGPRLINSIRAQMTIGAGLSVNDERGVDVESTRNIEGVLTFRTAYYTYDRPKTTLDVSHAVLPQPQQPGPAARAARRRRQA